MRNSLVPLVAAGLLIILAVILVRPTVARGQGGPAVNPGILRLPKRDPLRTHTMELVGSTAARLTAGSADDSGWQVVLIVGEDNSAMTRATMLALGEAVFTVGCIPLLDPLQAVNQPSPPLPLPADRVLRIRTVTSTPPDQLQATWSASVEIRLCEPRLPPGHPAETWQPAPIGPAALCLIQHDGRPAAGASGGWPERWAATGRAIATTALKTLITAPGLRYSKPIPNSWTTPVPAAPQTRELRWHGCFQQEFIGGWVGLMTGRSVSTKSGGSEPVEAPLIRQLLSGGWIADDNVGDWRRWTRPRDGILQHVALHPAADGLTVSMWIERPAPVDLVREWLSNRGDITTKARLARAATVIALPEELRAQAAAAAR